MLKQTRFTAPVQVCERRGKELSGWVYYLHAKHSKTVGTSARVIIGAATSTATAGGGKSTAPIVAPNQMAATRLAVSSVQATRAAIECIGTVGDAQLSLAVAASLGAPLSAAATTALAAQATPSTAQADASASTDRCLAKTTITSATSHHEHVVSISKAQQQATGCERPYAGRAVRDRGEGDNITKGGDGEEEREPAGHDGKDRKSEAIASAQLSYRSRSKSPPQAVHRSSGDASWKSSSAEASRSRSLSPVPAPSPDAPPLQPANRAGVPSPTALSHADTAMPEAVPQVPCAVVPATAEVLLAAVPPTTAAAPPRSRPAPIPRMPSPRSRARADSPRSTRVQQTKPRAGTGRSVSAPRAGGSGGSAGTTHAGGGNTCGLPTTTALGKSPRSERTPRNCSTGATRTPVASGGVAVTKPLVTPNRLGAHLAPLGSAGAARQNLASGKVGCSGLLSAAAPSAEPVGASAPSRQPPPGAHIDPRQTEPVGARPPLLLLSASSGSDKHIQGLYETMLSLVGPSAPTASRRVFLEELNTGQAGTEPVDFFHVAVDLAGHGYSRASLQRARKEGAIATGDFLAEIIKCCGKHFAFLIIASADGAAAVFEALCEQPNLCSFLCMRDPQVRNHESLHAIFQPTLLAVEGSGKKLLAVSNMAQALLHVNVKEFSKTRQPRYLDREFAADIVAFMRARRWRGHLSGFGHSKRRPLLTRLVGGMKMWLGEREYRPTARDAHKEAEATVNEMEETMALPPQTKENVVQFIVDERGNEFVADLRAASLPGTRNS